LNPEGHANVNCNAAAAKRIKTTEPGALDQAIYWVSYMAKQRGKLIYTNSLGEQIRVRRFDGSRLRMATALPLTA